MAKSVTAGEMRTRITVHALTDGTDDDGFRTETWLNILASEGHDELPEATAEREGQILQYNGTTTETYTQYHIYECVSDGEEVPAYSWQEYTTMIRCKWVSAHGKDVLENQRSELGQTATITLRHTSLINQRCRVFHESDAITDANAWKVISPNDPEDRHAFIEVTLLRKVVA